MAKGPTTSYQQQIRKLGIDGIYKDPRIQFLTDLEAELTRWINKGYNLIVMLDANKDVQCGKTKDTLNGLGLKEIFEEAVPNTKFVMQDRNKNGIPIDSIFTSPNIYPTKCGYKEFGEGCLSDYRVLWFDINLANILGKSTTLIKNQERKNVNIENPRAVEKYNFMLKSELDKENLFNQLFDLEEEAEEEEWSKLLEDNFNAIMDQQQLVRTCVVGRASLKTSGRVAWSPKIQKLKDNIEVWKLLWKNSKQMNISSRKLQQLIKQTKCINKNISDVSSKEATVNLQKAYKEYKDGRKEANSWRDKFLESLAMDRSEIRGTDIESERKKLINLGRQRRNYHDIKWLKGFKEL